MRVACSAQAQPVCDAGPMKTADPCVAHALPESCSRVSPRRGSRRASPAGAARDAARRAGPEAAAEPAAPTSAPVAAPPRSRASPSRGAGAGPRAAAEAARHARSVPRRSPRRRPAEPDGSETLRALRNDVRVWAGARRARCRGCASRSSRSNAASNQRSPTRSAARQALRGLGADRARTAAGAARRGRRAAGAADALAAARLGRRRDRDRVPERAARRLQRAALALEARPRGGCRAPAARARRCAPSAARAPPAARHRHMVSRETQFQRLRAGRWWVTVDGYLQSPSGEEVIATHFEEQELRVRRGCTDRLDFDFRPKDCPVDVKVVWDRRPVPDALVALRGVPYSLRYTRGGVVRVGVGRGPPHPRRRQRRPRRRADDRGRSPSSPRAS